MTRFRFGALALCLMSGAGVGLPADAGIEPPRRQEEEREIDRIVRGRKVVKRGNFAQLKNHRIPVGSRRTIDVGSAAARLFEDHLTFVGGIAKARAALLHDPRIEDEVVELEGPTVLTTSVSMTVVDPAALRRASPEFRRSRSGKGAGMKVGDLDAQGRADFNAYKKKVAGFADDHPLKKAAAKGDQDLLDAMAGGQGDVRVTTTIVIPKESLRYDDAGKVVAPKSEDDGTFGYGGQTTGKFKDRGGDLLPAKEAAQIVGPKTTETKKASFTSEFLLGDTDGESWTWSRRWDIPTGYFKVSAKAWYSYGMRIPIEIDATTEPAKIVTTGGRDVDSEYSVTLSARTLGAGSSFYEGVGLAKDKVHDGAELVLEAGFQVTFELKVLGIKFPTTSIPKDDAFHFNQDFKPPFGDSSGFEVWIDPKLTHTQVSLLGIVIGSVKAGVKVTGEGTVRVDYTALYGNDEIKSWAPGAKNDAKKTNTLTFTKSGEERTMKAEAPALEREGASKEFGYKLSNPRNDWEVKLIPGIRGDLEVKAKPIFHDTFTIGPLWLNDLAFDIGTWKFQAHSGTKNTYKVKNGEKTWKKSK